MGPAISKTLQNRAIRSVCDSGHGVMVQYARSALDVALKMVGPLARSCPAVAKEGAKHHQAKHLSLRRTVQAEFRMNKCFNFLLLHVLYFFCLSPDSCIFCFAVGGRWMCSRTCRRKYRSGGLLIITPKGRGPLGASVSLRTMYTCTCFGTLCRDSGLALVESADFLDYCLVKRQHRIHRIREELQLIGIRHH